MGLAASQARYLSLTAQVNNIEYQGQQINQERTVLSNQVSELYNQLLGMDVPTPPLTSEYTTLQYSFSTGTTTHSFDAKSVKPGSDGRYLVTTSFNESGNILEKDYSSKIAQRKEEAGNYTYNVAGCDCVKMVKTWEEIENDTNWQEKTGITTKEQFNQYLEAIQNAAIQYKTEDGTETLTADKFYVYATTSTSGEKTTKTPHFVIASDLENCSYVEKEVEGSNIGQGSVTVYNFTTGTVKKTKESTCDLIFDSATGRITSLNLYNDDKTNYTTYVVSSSTVTDEAAYEDAMAQYRYKQYLYDQQQTEINAKTERIQQEDKNLELKLTRLDTDRSAKEKELEAIKKVMDDDIDKSFKTFNG